MARTPLTESAPDGPVHFVDAVGGAIAALAAGVARARGRAATAETTSAVVRVPPEVGAVLAEIGAEAPAVAIEGKAVEAERVDLSTWGLALYAGEGELERLAAARIVRDRIERRLDTTGIRAV